MENKQYFLPGDVVSLRQNLDYKPTMVVVSKVKRIVRTIDEDKEGFFQGLMCRWFTTDGTLQEAVFNTKDLIKVE